MWNWDRAYNTFVILCAILGLAVLMSGITAYFAEDGGWPLFLRAVIGVTVMVVTAFGLGRAIEHVRRWIRGS